MSERMIVCLVVLFIELLVLCCFVVVEAGELLEFVFMFGIFV